MNWKTIFTDANQHRIVVEIELSKMDDSSEKRDWEDLSVIPENKLFRLAFCGNMGGSSGQIYDEISPRTPGQRELLKLWRECHLNDMHPGTRQQTEYLHSEDYQKDFKYLSKLLTGSGFITTRDDIIQRYFNTGSTPFDMEYFHYKLKLSKDDLTDQQKAHYENCIEHVRKKVWEKIRKNYTIHGILKRKLGNKGIYFENETHYDKTFLKYLNLFDTWSGELKNNSSNDFDTRCLLLSWVNLQPDREYNYGTSWLIKPLPDTIAEDIANLCKTIETEEQERKDHLVAELNTRINEEREEPDSDEDEDDDDDEELYDFDMTDKDTFDKDSEHVEIVMEVMVVDKDEAVRFVALGKAIGDSFVSIMDDWSVEDISQQRYSFGGTQYYIGTSSELEDVARDIIKGDDEYKYFWKQAVEAGQTEDGFEDWRESIVDIDGFAPTLDRYDGEGTTVKVMNSEITVCRAD